MDPGDPGRDLEAERAEIAKYTADQPAEIEVARYKESLGRIPVGPGRGWRARERRARSCEVCEGDLWVETADGEHRPCVCREDRAKRRASNRMRAGNWWRGTSLSFAAPPLSQVDISVSTVIDRLCSAIHNQHQAQNLWLTGGPEQGKSAVCAYLGQRLFSTGDVAVEHLGDLLAHMRWLGAVKGEAAVEAKIEKLASVSLLVLDDLDRPHRTFPASSSLAMRDSCSSRDLVRVSMVLSERLAGLRPIIVTSRVAPAECAARIAAIRRKDLVRGLLATAGGNADPFEDFPEYTEALLVGALSELQDACREYSLDSTRRAAAAA
jgi:DNA replication protein DnaC